MVIQQKQAANIEQSPPQEMSIQDMEDLKQHYLDEMKSLINEIQIKDYRNEKIDIRYRRECEVMIDELKAFTTFQFFFYDDDDDYDYEESTIPLNEIVSQIPPSIVITTSPSVLPIKDPEDSLIMGNEELSTIPEKEIDEVIKSSVEDLVLIPSESEDTSGSDSEYDLSSCDDFSPIDDPEGKSVTFSNPLFDLNDDFTSSDDESLSDGDFPKDNVKIYSNPLFEFHDEYIFSDVNPFFDEVLENIENKDSYDSNLDEPDLLVTPLFDANEDECFDLRSDIDEIDAFNILSDFEDGFYDSKGDVLYLESLLSDDMSPNPPPKEFLDRDPRSLSDINDLKIIVKVFDPRISEKFFSPTYVSLPFEDRHYILFTYVIQIFLPYFTYPVDSPFLLSSGSEDTIFDPDISVFHFFSVGSISSEWNFHKLQCLSKHLE
uniref:Reverse transcriptase domain-containing protein n=1 Tax=Tanacetum cinerariifolium TaxID=118510 RepID=A0A699I4R4_TANCI|nr:hypothetical protein [Tanacetum cinerariifolium]